MEGKTRGERRGIGSLLGKNEDFDSDAAEEDEEDEDDDDGDSWLPPLMDFFKDGGLSCRGRGAWS